MRARRLVWLVLAGLVLVGGRCAAPDSGGATVREYTQVFRTYPFSDPDPIPVVGRIYPYFRFDGYTNEPVDMVWKVVALENDYLKVLVLPQVGGKIWTAIEKSTNRAFLYDNQVIKFRDVAMRGPWTSGGIEANYGIIGHTPNCATPVDYTVRVDADGSASVVIGVLDLLTRTPWRLEIRLPGDKAYFTTRSFWHNQTPLEQPYYTWMNAGIKAAGNLELIYPGTHHIGHDGRAFPWPIHPDSGKNLSFYEQNDFGPYKSYHVVGTRAEFFGAYWHDDDFGMGRYALRDDKLGKKAWIWGLSRQGMIWERLLTDSDGQYVEVQSGRLFNQAAADSTETPFKHRGFAPYSSDTWTEYWFPVKGTRGFVAANDHGALNVRHEGGRLTLDFSPLERLEERLEVLDADTVVYTAPLDLDPLETWSTTLDRDIPAERLRVRVGGRRLEYGPPGDDVLSRPLETPARFDWESVLGLYLKGKESLRQREYVQARSAFEACLKQDAFYVPALADLAMLRYRALDDVAAFDLARRALAVDTYDPAANYAYGLAAARLGKAADALDGFEVAAQAPEHRGAAWTAITRVFMRRGRIDLAAVYANRALDVNRLNLEALQLLALAARLQGDGPGARAARDAVLALDPLNHFARFEAARADGRAESWGRFTEGIRNEQPHETFLELAIWYHDLGQVTDATRVLQVAPATAETLYWLAWLQNEAGDSASADALRQAREASPRLVFPFRPESVAVFTWAVARQPGAWQPKYYLALTWWGLGEAARARALLAECADLPDHAPFYAARAAVFRTVARDRSLGDLVRAAELDPREWRYGRLLVEQYLGAGARERALETARRYAAAHPRSYILGMLLARTLLVSGAYREAADVLGRLDVLPYEGATDGRRLHREAQLLMGVEELGDGRAEVARRHVALAREWPENLGAGKPYPEDVDERLEDWLEIACLDRLRRSGESAALLARLGGDAARPGFGQLLSALALARSGRRAEATRALESWVAREPNPALAAWGRRVYAGERPPLPPGAARTEEVRVFAVWLKTRG